MADKESPGAKRTRKEQELNPHNSFVIDMYRDSAVNKVRKMLGDDGYGTSLGAGARAAEKATTQKEWDEGKSLREMEPEVRRAMREAAAEERREARGMKKGGAVKSASSRADGIAQRGKTRGKMI